MKSIRVFLLSRLLGWTTLVLVGAGVAVYVALTRSLQAEFDQNLADRVQSLASILFQVKDQVQFEFSDQLMPEYEREQSPDYFELRFADGRLLEGSNSLRGKELSVQGTPGAEPACWDALLPDGRPGRYVAQQIEVHHVYPEEGPDRPTAAKVRVVIACGREELARIESTALGQCALVCLLLIGLIATVSWIAVERGLEPARRLGARLDAIRVDHLPGSLDAGEMPSELAPVAGKIDALIRRVDAAFQRERRTTADIAHELRTPISELLTVSEVALRDGRDPEASRRALGRVRDVAARMGRALSTLLKLARLEMGAEKTDREAVDLGVVVEELLRSLSAVGRERGIRVENEVAPGTRVEADREVLRIVASNLLSNAFHYSPPGGEVLCRLEASGDGWRLVVQNEAVDLRPEDLRHLSEPFWRRDGARTDPDRSGLGLALSRVLAAQTGMELSFELEAATFRAMLASRGGSDGRLPPVAGQVSETSPVRVGRSG